VFDNAPRPGLCGALVVVIFALWASAPVQAASPVRLPWFYNDPTDGTATALIASRHSEVTMHKGDEWYLAELKRAGYGGRAYQYIDGPNKLSNSRGSWGFGVDDAAGEASTHPNWWLYDGSGRRTGYLDPGSTGWQSYSEKRATKALVGDATGGAYGYNGIYLDEVWGWADITRRIGATIRTADGTVLTGALWNERMNAYLDALTLHLHSLGQFALHGNVGNLAGAQAFGDHLELYLIENWVTGWPSTTDPSAAPRWWSASDIQAAWRLADIHAGQGRHVLLIGQSQVLAAQDEAPTSAIELQRMRFSFAAYLMVAEANLSYRYANVYGTNAYRAFWDYPEYHADLGNALAARYAVTASTWRRDFANGVALANVSSRTTDSLALGGTYKTLAGTTVSSVTLAPHTGIVLLRGAPVAESPPSVAGLAVSGETLVASPGTWSGQSIEYAFRWLRCDSAGEGCKIVGGATSQSHVLSALDVGSTLRVAVTATNAGGATVATSAPSAGVAPANATESSAAPAPTFAPTIIGAAKQGETLEATPGSWLNDPTAFAHQWLRCDAVGDNCVSINGAVESSYQLTQEDVRTTVRVRVIAANAYAASSADSAATAVVQKGIKRVRLNAWRASPMKITAGGSLRVRVRFAGGVLLSADRGEMISSASHAGLRVVTVWCRCGGQWRRVGRLATTPEGGFRGSKIIRARGHRIRLRATVRYETLVARSRRIAVPLSR
jgi:hypothetical protein